MWRDSCLGYRFSEPWLVRPWLFIPTSRRNTLKQQIEKIKNGQDLKFDPKITDLEEVQPWCYRTFSLNDEELPRGVESKTPIILP